MNYLVLRSWRNRLRIGTLIENPGVYGNMTAKENLEVIRRNFGFPSVVLPKKAATIFAMVLLPNRRGLVIQKYLCPFIIAVEISSSIIRDLSTKNLVPAISLYPSYGALLFKNIPMSDFLPPPAASNAPYSIIYWPFNNIILPQVHTQFH